MNQAGTHNPIVTQAQVEAALLRLESVVDSPRALTIRPDERAALHQAIDRAHAQLLGEADAVLTIALAGCTGAGKSTLINALAGSMIAESSDRRPCTMQTRVYHHGEVPAGGLPKDLADQAIFVPHDRPELRQKVIVDTPDLDTFYTANRAATRAMLKAAGLVIYVFSPERYVEERAWSVIREEQRFSACLAVLNKADTVAPEVLERIAEEIRQRFAEMGKPDIRVLRVAAAAHVGSPDGQVRVERQTVDEFVTLRAYIEHELQAGDVAKLIRQQRQRVIDHLEEQVRRVVPTGIDTALEALQKTASEHTTAACTDLAESMYDRLVAIEEDLAPLVIVRKHQRFWGPFRTWLAVTDFLRYGLPRLVRQVRVLAGDPSSATSRTLADQADRVGDRVRQLARVLQDFCFAEGLPVERWQAVTAEIDGRMILEQITRQIEGRFEALAAAAFRRTSVFTWVVSLIAWVLPAVLVIFALLNLLRQFLGAPLAGWFSPQSAVGRFLTESPPGTDVLWNFLALIVLSFLLLHILTGVVLSGRSVFARSSIARQGLDQTLHRVTDGWTSTYRKDVEADVAALREPLEVLRTAVAGTILRPSRAMAATAPEDAALAAEGPAEIANRAEMEEPVPEAAEAKAPAAEQEEEQLPPAELVRRAIQAKKR